MGLFLKIAVVILVGVVIAAGVLLIALRLFVKGIAGQVAQGLAGGIVGMPPMRISLDRSEAPSGWDDDTSVDQMSADLMERGFEAVGDFDVLEMNGVRVRGFVHPERYFLAAITEHPSAGVFVDLVHRFEDPAGSDRNMRCVTVTSAPETGLAPPPWKTEVRQPGAGVDQLWSQLEAHALDTSVRADTSDDFASIFETSFAREMDWLIERGGPSAEEIRAIAELSGGAGPEEIDMVRRAWSGRVQEELETRLRDRFVATTDMTAGAWAEVADRVVFVHDHLDAEQLDDLVAGALTWDDDDACEAICTQAAELRDGATGRSGFIRMQGAVPASRHYEKIGGVDEPIPADVYVAPDDLASFAERAA